VREGTIRLIHVPIHAGMRRSPTHTQIIMTQIPHLRATDSGLMSLRVMCRFNSGEPSSFPLPYIYEA
jgi:hypothetical protein